MGKRSAGVGVHAHGCTECGRRYEDACTTMQETKEGGTKTVAGPDRLCTTCRTGHPEPWWPEARLPRDCCRAHSRVARKEERDVYRLAGSGPWFICVVCYRTFPFRDPTLELT